MEGGSHSAGLDRQSYAFRRSAKPHQGRGELPFALLWIQLWNTPEGRGATPIWGWARSAELLVLLAQKRPLACTSRRLAAYDYGGRGTEVVLLLHGLAGHAREWDDTAAWLTASKRVIALDQRGHGRSERQPSDMSRDAFVSDVVAWMDRLTLEKAVLVGQSLGGHTAFLTAARHPSLVAGLIVAEASPESDPTSIEVVR